MATSPPPGHIAGHLPLPFSKEVTPPSALHSSQAHVPSNYLRGKIEGIRRNPSVSHHQTCNLLVSILCSTPATPQQPTTPPLRSGLTLSSTSPAHSRSPLLHCPPSFPSFQFADSCPPAFQHRQEPSVLENLPLAPRHTVASAWCLSSPTTKSL